VICFSLQASSLHPGAEKYCRCGYHLSPPLIQYPIGPAGIQMTELIESFSFSFVFYFLFYYFVLRFFGLSVSSSRLHHALFPISSQLVLVSLGFGKVAEDETFSHRDLRSCRASRWDQSGSQVNDKQIINKLSSKAMHTWPILELAQRSGSY
jgi:hypothetical protein